MNELALHILDLVQNSITAGADFVQIIISESTQEDSFIIEIIDNGCGMSEDFVKKVTDPFVTTRKTRKVGLGIPLFKSAAMSCGGDLLISSKVNEGTKLTATFKRSHIDRAPLGDMAETMAVLINGAPEIDFLYKHTCDEKNFTFDTREIKAVLGEVPISTPDVILFIKESINEELSQINF